MSGTGRSIGICPATLLLDPMAATEDDVRATARAAVDAGFVGASVWTPHVPGLTGVDLQIEVLEAAIAWAGTDSDAAEAEAQLLADLVGAHGATKVLASALDPVLPEPDLARRNLASLSERLGPLGATVCVEFFAWSAISDLATAWELVEPLREVGLTIDTFHWQRQPGGPNLALLASIPGDRITFVQVADTAAEAEGEPLAEALSGRLLPGQGVVDFAALFGVLDEIGATPFIATEIFRPTLVAELGLEAAAAAMLDAARSMLP